ncbi:MAG: 16S rRNA (guanine(966)-N(2))-methyltransferase RsmD [Proteobacteria bacterium]|nr:16S rRNA (guanine(966)-N(2))-methyltransferase RsmD [Pseudomonadota bacterium]
MRIVAGSARGRRLEVPKGVGVRPTASSIREALFSSLGPKVQQAVVLDAFAGSGALGLEALSRGAQRTVFIEQHRGHLAVLRRNIEHCGFAARSEVVSGDALVFLAHNPKGLCFDLIFLDPPYGASPLEPALARIAAGRWLSDGGIIVAEHDAGRLPALPAALHFTRTRTYGNTALSTLALQGAAHEEA